MLKYFLLWFPMLALAIFNGLLREWYKQFTGELTARQISTVTLIIFFAVYIYWVINTYPPRSSNFALMIGFLWLALTLAFEFGFGLYRGNSWSQLLSEYNILAGKLWILVPIWVAVAPYLFYIYKR